jgi:acyl carrier protein
VLHTGIFTHNSRGRGVSDRAEQTVIHTASDIFGVPKASLTLASSPKTVEGWDSVQHLNLVLALEESAGIQIDPEEIDQMKTLGDIVSMVRSKLSK